MLSFKITYRDAAHPTRTVTRLIHAATMAAAVSRACADSSLTPTRIAEFDRGTGHEIAGTACRITGHEVAQ